jgi:DNA-binding SARP family transcriptional activator
MIELRVLGTIRLQSDDQAAMDGLAAQPKALALLIYLALARPRGFHQRDRIVGLFWPELDQEHARGALRKLLQRLRQSIGDEAIQTVGTESLALSPAAVWCDAAQFDDELERGAFARALELHRGELMPGFYLPGSDEFERWLDDERAYYRERAVNTAWTMVESFAKNDQRTNATQLARVVARLAPTDERMLRRVLTMLDTLGDRAGAIQVFTDFAARPASRSRRRALRGDPEPRPGHQGPEPGAPRRETLDVSNFLGHYSRLRAP